MTDDGVLKHAAQEQLKELKQQTLLLEQVLRAIENMDRTIFDGLAK